jgi:hypothetical protein
MAKKQPAGTTGRIIYIPNDLQVKLRALTSHGGMDELIIQCIRTAIEPRWREYSQSQLHQGIAYDGENENRQRPIRRGSAPDAGKASAKDQRNKSSKETR